ncbi:hypothetical protein BU23DRAFT_374620, partial [Bimuria novae-zelandiae CBS 107.79]
IKSLEPCKTFSYVIIAKKYSIIYTTLMRRHKGIIALRTTQAELVKYIEGLIACQLQPIREIVRNFASAIVKQDVG